ncbi:hypothetical protein FQN54_001797 [Arachnomyces sp. PD_36]|nr:hypothetical protein FQN54_001797 [Arachnomyces sp. PD_36]
MPPFQQARPAPPGPSVASGINVGYQQNPGPSSSPEYDSSGSSSGEEASETAGGDVSTTETLSPQGEGSYTNTPDPQSQPALSPHSGSDWGDRFEKPTDSLNRSPPHNSEAGLAQPARTSDTRARKQYHRLLQPRPLGSLCHIYNNNNKRVRPKKRGRETGSRLSEETRKNALWNKRNGGMCLNCKAGRVMCDFPKTATGIPIPGPCASCKGDQNRFRAEADRDNPPRGGWKWFELIETRRPRCIKSFYQLIDYFRPENLLKQLWFENIQKFFHENAVDVEYSSFKLPLNANFSKDMIFPAIEFEARGIELHHSRGLYAKDLHRTEVISNPTLPVRVDWRSPARVRDVIGRWVVAAVETDFLEYPRFFYPYQKWCWVAEVLIAVCKFHQEWKEYRRSLRDETKAKKKLRLKNEKTLTSACEATILSTFMSCCPYIPGAAMPFVKNNLKFNGPLPETPKTLPKGSILAPRMVNKVIKGFAWDEYEPRLKGLLDGLTEILKRKEKLKGSWGHALCSLILLLTTVDGPQSSLVDQYLLNCNYKPENATLEDRMKLRIQLLNMDIDLVDSPIDLFQKQYGRYNPFKPGSESLAMDPPTRNLVDRIKGIFTPENVESCFELRDKKVWAIDDPKEFGNMNPPRLLTKLLGPFFLPDMKAKKQRAPGRRG